MLIGYIFMKVSNLLLRIQKREANTFTMKKLSMTAVSIAITLASDLGAGQNVTNAATITIIKNQTDIKFTTKPDQENNIFFLNPGETSKNIAWDVFGSVNLRADNTKNKNGMDVSASGSVDLTNSNNQGRTVAPIVLGNVLPGQSRDFTFEAKDHFDSNANFKVGNFTINYTIKFNPEISGNISGEVKEKPVPEPLTIFGSGMALGFGALFKKEYSRKKKRAKALEKQKA